MKWHDVSGMRRVAVLCALAGFHALAAEAANNVAPPNVLWHNKATGQNRLWLMSGVNFVSETALPATTDDPNWQVVGTGDFNGDSSPDIVWQNQATGQNAVWYMNGTIQTSAATIQSAGDLNWKVVGVADFNGDSKPDLLWQNIVTAQNAVWLMNGTAVLSYNLIVSNGDPNWRIVAAGDLDSDGKPDIVLRHQTTGQNAVWFMNGLNLASGLLLKMADGSEAPQSDLDWKIVGLGDYNGDGKADLLWRHATLGLGACWFLNGNVVIGSSYFAKHEFDTDWKSSGQELADSTWRLQKADYTWLRATVATTPARVALTFRIPPNSSFGVTVQRRLLTDTSWATLLAALQGTNYADTAVAQGQRYEYRVFRETFNGVQSGVAEHVCVAINAPPLENRGKVVVLVDRTLTNQLVASLDQLKRDLVGDGWSVVRYDVPRHIDDYSTPTAFQTNAYNLTNVIKPLVRSAFNADPANTKAVLIVGHVTIPYSGSFSVDGHSCAAAPLGPDHRGGWPADMFYGDLDGTWTDSTVNYINCNFPEGANVPGDGRFDQDGIASPYILKLAVGRIDFARLPVLTSTPPTGFAARSEAALIQQYLAKNHQYRSKLLSWQAGSAPTRTLAYGHFHDSRDDRIFENAANAATAVGTDPNGLVVGDFCFQRTKPSAFGFISGSGACDRVNDSIPVLEHSSADLVDPANEPKAVFFTVLASFLGDWNLSNNNYLRCLLSTPNFGLASVWTRNALWRFDAMGVGEHLGASQTRMVNDPKELFFDRSRDLAILGDPTLRLHVVAPPAGLTATSMKGKVHLAWTNPESGAQFYVYRGGSVDGPFTRISSSAVTGTTFADTLPSTKQKVYMVRALKSVTVTNGSYMNMSQGTFATAN